MAVVEPSVTALAPRRLPRLPRRVRDRVSQWRADVDMVVRDLRGQRLPVYERRHTDRFAAHEAELRSAQAGDTAGAEPVAALAPGTDVLPSESVETITLRDGDDEYRFEVEPGETILEAAERSDAPLPYSCAMGGCGSCRVKVLSGHIVVDEPNCLTDAERAEGHALTCVGRPAGPCTVEVA